MLFYNLSNSILISFILIQSIVRLESFVVCSSIKLQNNIDEKKLVKLKECSIVIGHVQIINFNGTTLNNTTILFPSLIEITDYLLVFQVKNVKSLSQLFPKLTIIRGKTLFKNYALIIFQTNSLLQINLKSLMKIDNGDILFNRLYHACFINTIDWSYLLANKSELNKELVNGECFNERCHSRCETNNCWSSDKASCQLKCKNKQCKHNCRIDETSKCCENNLCMYCDATNNCLSCSKYRDLNTGKCVLECPSDMLIYENHSCVKREDCSRDLKSVIKMYHILNETHCVRECPFGYMPQLSRDINISYCVKCNDNVCKRDCSISSFRVKSFGDLKKIEKCWRVKSLHIEFNNVNMTYEHLEKSLQYLEEIDEYLVIVRNRYLKTLRFFKQLRLINGLKLYEQKFAFFVHTNEILRELWPYEQNKFQIKHGTVKFFENPHLCFGEIQNFMLDTLKDRTHLIEAEVSFNFNGYNRLTCSNETIDLDFKLDKYKLSIVWNVTFSDLRRLKGFILSYIRVPTNNFSFDHYDLEFLHSSTVSFSSYKSLKSVYFNMIYEWNYLYIQFDEIFLRKHSLYRATIGVEPFTRYAVYLKADLAYDDAFDWNFNESSLFANSFKTDKMISKIYYVHSLAAKPSKVEVFTHEMVSSSNSRQQQAVKLKWQSPAKENGIIESYFIYYTALDDLEPFPYNTDTCQQSFSLSNHEFVNQTIKQNVKDEMSKHNLDCYPYLMHDLKFSMPKAINKLKNRLISVEDEIYNLAFRPAKIQRLNSNLNLISSPIINFSSPKIEIPRKILNNTISLNLTEQLKHLFSIEESFNHDNLINVSNMTFNFTLNNLKPFSRYLVSISACQHLSGISIEDACSSPSSFTLRTLPNLNLDKVNETFILNGKFNWYTPATTNGLILKYNIKIIDASSNKTHGIFCHPVTESTLNLSIHVVSVDLFLLKQGHEYFIQIQPITMAGSGLWSNKLKYKMASELRDYVKYLLSGILFTLFLLMLGVLVILKLIRKNTTKNSKSNVNNGNYYYFSPDEWEISRENVQIGERIGSGCFAEVHKGRVKLKKMNGIEIDCAIKFCGSDEQSRQRILKEGNMMKSISTTHIVKLLAVVSKNNPAYLVLEYMDKGDLKEYLRCFKMENRKLNLNQEISEQRFYRIASEIADGMLWLSEHKYVHRDLAARNCLISKDDVIKIADLGLSKDIYQNPVYREKCKSLLPIRWMSPESLLDGSSTTKSDVWSYGVVLYELCTYGDNPYNEIKDNEQVIEFVKSGGRLEVNEAPIKFLTLMDKCLVREDFKRISFKEILDILDPDLANDFKQTSYYHNQFRNKILINNNNNVLENSFNENKSQNLDNYM